MKYRIFIIGLDGVFSDEKRSSKRKKLKVLEMQTIQDCLPGPIHQKAVKRLTSIIKKRYPELQVLMPEFNKDAKYYDNYAKIASLEKLNGMINIGLEPFSRGKWNFYSFCNQHSELKEYIPETHIPSLSGLQNFNIDELKKTSLFKPADASEGLGVHLLSQEDMKDSKVLRQKLSTCSIVQGQLELFKDFYPFVLQEFLGHNIEVTRIYALVIFDYHKNEYRFFIDEKNSFRYAQVEEKNDFKVESNKDSVVKTISSEEIKEIFNFLNAFFRRLKTTYDFNYRYWEVLAKQYISHHELTNSQRLLLFSKFSLAVCQHQRFTSNKLSIFQCMLLGGFIKRLVESGDARKYKTCVNGSIKNAFGFFRNHNTRHQEPYLLGNVLKKFGSILKDTDPEKPAFLSIPESKLLSINPVPLSCYQYGHLLDFMTKKEKENYCAVSKNSLNLVAAWCGL